MLLIQEKEKRKKTKALIAASVYKIVVLKRTTRKSHPKQGRMHLVRGGVNAKQRKSCKQQPSTSSLINMALSRDRASPRKKML
jgi:hypothetical protein